MTRSIFLFLFLAGLLGVNIGLAQDQSIKGKASIWKGNISEPDKNGKYKIEGPWGIGDPVHETLTLHALIDGGIFSEGTIAEDEAAVQFIRGVFWSDDPCAQLFSGNDISPLEPSTGIQWYEDFERAKCKASDVEEQGFRCNLLLKLDMVCPLLERSHFGDLQFLHGMANHDEIKACDTVESILHWASIAYRVALGELLPRQALSRDPVANSLLTLDAQKSPMKLFLAKTESETRARAFGALLHMVQDSYAGGHVSRVSKSAGQPAGIIQFLSYVNQDEEKHAHDDSWVEGENDLERALGIPGARAALEASTELVRFYKAGEKWPKVENYLKDGPFFVRADAKNSDAGRYK